LISLMDLPDKMLVSKADKSIPVPDPGPGPELFIA
jgi:hypothetical protein